jgi:hypothetical protein
MFIFLSPKEDEESGSFSDNNSIELTNATFFAGILTFICALLGLILPFFAYTDQAYSTTIKIWSVVLNIGIAFGSACAVFSVCCCSGRPCTLIYVNLLSTLAPFILFIAGYELLFGFYNLRFTDTKCYGEVDYNLIKKYSSIYDYNRFSSVENEDAENVIIFWGISAGGNLLTFIVERIYVTYITKINLFGTTINSMV